MKFSENRFVASVNDRSPCTIAERHQDSRVVGRTRCVGPDRQLLRKNLVAVFGIVVLTTAVAGTVPSVADDSSSKPASTRNKKGLEQPKETTSVDGPSKVHNDKKDDAMKRPPKIVKTNAEWKKILKPEQFRVTRLKETELAYSGKFWHNKKPGKYLCVCCGEELYSSAEKFESGTGWPSFWAPISEQAIGTETDNSLETVRTEVHCDRCGAHLGHIFDDGPAPTGMRHCINSASLKFVPEETAKSK